METKRKALGKGLEELFNMEPLDINKLEKKIVEETPLEEIKLIPLKELRSNPYQPRKNFDEEALEELANSIKEHGVFQPIIVKKSIKGYDIIAGERRVKASLKAGLDKIPAIIRNFSDREMMEIALIENLQREDLSAIEEAEAYQKMIEVMKITQEELSKRIGKSRSHITNVLGLLRLPKSVQEMVLYNKISMGHARALSKLEDKEQIVKLANKIIDESLTVRQLEELTISDDYKRKVPITKKRKDPEYDYVADQLSEKLGTKVKITNSKIEISFTSYHDLNRILDIIGINNRE
jgi:ParB family chromosome partitioning protein